MSVAKKLKHAFVASLLAVNGLTFTSSALRTHDAFDATKGNAEPFTAGNVVRQMFNSSAKESMDWVNYSMQTPGERQENPPCNPSEWVAGKTAAVWRFMGDENNTSLMNFLPGNVVSIAGLPGCVAGSAAGSVWHAVQKPPAPK